jgi:transcriptional regulator with XRE-family HTH domain
MHKYERGLNRIPARSLYEIAQLLDLPIEYFYYGLPQEIRRPNTAERSTLSETTYYFSAIKNEKHQEAFSQLVRALAGQ